MIAEARKLPYISRMTLWRKCTDAFIATEVDDELILLDLAGGELFSLSGTGRAIWDAVDGSRDTGAIGKEVAAQFDATLQVIEAETAAFLGELQATGLIA